MKNKNIQNLAVIIQCRISSSRLPGKALKKLGGKTVFEWTMDSMKKVGAGNYIVVTDEESFPKLQPLAFLHGWKIVKGPLEDVLERFCIAIRKFGCKTVLRATADNPFLFYEAAQALVDEYFKQNQIQKCDYMTWTGLPHGSGVEIFDAESLLKAAEETKDPYDHEHVGPALYNHKTRFTSLFYKAPARFYFPEYRTTIDTPSDYRRAAAVVSKLSNGKAPFSPYTTEEIISAVSDPDVHDTILFFPSTKKGHGTGHLRRCLESAKKSECFVYIPENPELEETESIVSEFIESGLNPGQIIHTFPEQNEFALIVADLFKMDSETAQKLSEVANLVDIDDGGDFYFFSDYLIDIIPSFGISRVPNLTEEGFITKPEAKKTCRPQEIQTVLVSVGGEDPAELSLLAANYFSSAGKKVTVISSMKENLPEIKNVSFVPPVPCLREKLCEFDLVATHYGLTAFEALAAGCAVVLLPTSKLHENLSKKYGFAVLSAEELKNPPSAHYFDEIEKFFPQEITEKICRRQESLSDFVKKLSHGKKYFCPVCGKSENVDEVVARTPERTFRRCAGCGIIYISWNSSLPMKYEKEYFAEQYKKQYGRTYLEDFDFIKKNCVKRIQEINGMLKLKRTSSPRILDIGCAYGPFLSAAQENGWQAYGTDVSKDAVEYVRKNLLLPAVVSAFPDFDAASEFGINQFEAVSMWFVIEHFSDLKSVLEKVSSLVKKGGIFAFSTPSAEGISGKTNEKSFFEKSPSDHFSVWEPSKAQKILSKFGFSVEKIVSTGHHPERFPSVKKRGAKKNGIIFNACEKISHVLKLGDTCEIYCRKL